MVINTDITTASEHHNTQKITVSDYSHSHMFTNNTAENSTQTQNFTDKKSQLIRIKTKKPSKHMLELTFIR